MRSRNAHQWEIDGIIIGKRIGRPGVLRSVSFCDCGLQLRQAVGGPERNHCYPPPRDLRDLPRFGGLTYRRADDPVPLQRP
ncbi:hypothetical protein MTBSS4_120068 [Magnetospirillum sp. SS-4]|nr:hypothetical protein MTBSS4_120068 [Magnetospirillum sp. SS-4]